MLETKYGIKHVHIESTKVSTSPSKSNGSGLDAYLFRKVQGPYLLRSDNYSLVLHGIAEDMVRFIKTSDYDIDREEI